MPLSLPFELISKIFSYFTIKETLKCSIICKKFHEMLKNDSFWVDYNNKNIYKQIIESLTLIKRIQNAKFVKSFDPGMTGDIISFNVTNDNYIILYHTNRHLNLDIYCAQIFDNDLNLLRKTDFDILAWDKNKYVNVNYHIKCHLSDEDIIQHNEPYSLMTISDDYIIYYNDKELLVTNLLSKVISHINFSDIKSVRIYGHELAIILQKYKWMLLKYDLIDNKILCEFEINIPKIDFKVTSLVIKDYDGQYLTYFCGDGLSITGSYNSLYACIDTLTNKIIITGNWDFEFMIYDGKYVIDFMKDEIFDIANLVGHHKIKILSENDGLIDNGFAIKDGMIVTYTCDQTKLDDYCVIKKYEF